MSQSPLSPAAGRISIPAIVRIGLADRTGTLYNGGLRHRLRVVTQDGTEQMFVILSPGGSARCVD
jgi:hypothetical protein